MIDSDESIAKLDVDKLRTLPAAFIPGGADAQQYEGTITAGNSSPITDGAAAIVLASG